MPARPWIVVLDHPFYYPRFGFSAFAGSHQPWRQLLMTQKLSPRFWQTAPPDQGLAHRSDLSVLFCPAGRVTKSCRRQCSVAIFESLYREGKGLDKATLSEDRYISKRLQTHLGGHMAHELGGAEIRSFLDTAKTSDSLEHKQNPR